MSRRTTYTDDRGRRWAVDLPDGAPELDAPMGIPVGPPSTEELGLPEDIQVRLHNALVERGLLTERDVKQRRGDVLGAIQTAFGLYVRHIVRLYTIPREEAPAPPPPARPPAPSLPARTAPPAPSPPSSAPAPPLSFGGGTPKRRGGQRKKETTA